jgi:hypothetical protein
MEIERDMSILGEMLANGNYRAHVRKAVGSVDAGAGWDAAFGKTLGHRSAILTTGVRTAEHLSAEFLRATTASCR